MRSWVWIPVDVRIFPLSVLYASFSRSNFPRKKKFASWGLTRLTCAGLASKSKKPNFFTHMWNQKWVQIKLVDAVVAPAVDVAVAEPDSSLRCVERVAAGRTVCSGRSRSQTQNVERERKKFGHRCFFHFFRFRMKRRRRRRRRRFDVSASVSTSSSSEID